MNTRLAKRCATSNHLVYDAVIKKANADKCSESTDPDDRDDPPLIAIGDGWSKKNQPYDSARENEEEYHHRDP